MTHRTPIDYLNYYRIEQACFKLATSNDSIAEIGLSCGFNDESYFIKTFKKYKGGDAQEILKRTAYQLKSTVRSDLYPVRTVLSFFSS